MNQVLRNEAGEKSHRNRLPPSYAVNVWSFLGGSPSVQVGLKGRFANRGQVQEALLDLRDATLLMRNV